MTLDETLTRAEAIESDAELLAEVQCRHRATQQAARWFRLAHLMPGQSQLVSYSMQVTARNMIHSLPDGPELTKGLNDLLRAKDWFVRAAVAATEGEI